MYFEARISTVKPETPEESKIFIDTISKLEKENGHGISKTDEL